MPLGNSTHRFSANKEWFFLRTNSLLISKARPTHQWIPVLCMQSPRSETAGQGWPSAQDVLCRVCFTHSSSLYSGAVFSPRRCPWFPWWCIRLSQGGVVPSLLRLQLSTAETTFPGRCWPSALLCPSLRAQTWSRCRRSCCKAWMCFTSPRTWAECFPALYREQFQLVLLDLSFPWRAKVVSLLPCLCSEWTLKHLQPE